MTDIQTAALAMLAYLNGLLVGYILWAPVTTFKQGFMNAISFGLWREKK